MSVCVPVRSMKNTAEFAELVERERDVTVTKNGCEVDVYKRQRWDSGDFGASFSGRTECQILK